MKILYLHGLRERDSKILSYLKTLPHQITAPSLNPWKPAETLRIISEIPADKIVGFSMGGYFGSLIKKDIPKLLINPALCFPDIVLSRRNIDPVLSAEYRELKPFPGKKIKAIFTTEDHKIGLRSLPEYKELYSEDSISYIPGGHEPGVEIEGKINEFLL